MIRQQLLSDQLAALKSGDKDKLETLRFAVSKIKNQEIEKKAELNDEETVLVLQKIVRELNETREAAEKASRQDLIDQSNSQIKLLSVYLPAQLTDDELKIEIEKLIEQNKELFEKNKKAIIGLCVKHLKAKADSNRIMNVLQPYLQ